MHQLNGARTKARRKNITSYSDRILLPIALQDLTRGPERKDTVSRYQNPKILISEAEKPG